MSSDHKGRPAQPDPPVRWDLLVLRVQPDPPVRWDLLVLRVQPVLRGRPARKAIRGRQALCVTSKGLEMLSLAMMAKYLFRPFARKVLLPFKEPPGPNVAQQPE
jgi:hypothetical protein